MWHKGPVCAHLQHKGPRAAPPRELPVFFSGVQGKGVREKLVQLYKSRKTCRNGDGF